MTVPDHQWKFFRAGGFDQVLLESGADLLALPQLDKLAILQDCGPFIVTVDGRYVHKAAC